MRKKLIMLVLILVIGFSFVGCSENKGEAGSDEGKDLSTGIENIDYEKMYKPILDRYYWNIENSYPNGAENLSDGDYYIYSLIESGYEDSIYRVGYRIEDINEDGVPELFIGEVEKDLYSPYPGNYLAAAFTVVEGEVVNLFEGWSRSSYLYLDKGRFLNQASSGAAYYSFSEFEIEKESSDLSYEGFYFTTYDEETDSVTVYRNDEGYEEEGISEKLDWTLEECLEASDELAHTSVVLEMTPFSEYEFEGHGWYCNEFNADYVKNYADKAAEDIDFSYINSDKGEDNILICFDKEAVKEFSVVALSDFEINEYNELMFSYTELENFGAVDKAQKILIGEEIYGAIPNYGFVYVDKNGWKHCYAVQVSGYDGGLILESFYESNS